jgi:hypothetical protein
MIDVIKEKVDLMYLKHYKKHLIIIKVKIKLCKMN